MLRKQEIARRQEKYEIYFEEVRVLLYMIIASVLPRLRFSTASHTVDLRVEGDTENVLRCLHGVVASYVRKVRVRGFTAVGKKGMGNYTEGG